MLFPPPRSSAARSRFPRSVCLLRAALVLATLAMVPLGVALSERLHAAELGAIEGSLRAELRP